MSTDTPMPALILEAARHHAKSMIEANVLTEQERREIEQWLLDTQPLKEDQTGPAPTGLVE